MAVGLVNCDERNATNISLCAMLVTHSILRATTIRTINRSGWTMAFDSKTWQSKSSVEPSDSLALATGAPQFRLNRWIILRRDRLLRNLKLARYLAFLGALRLLKTTARRMIWRRGASTYGVTLIPRLAMVLPKISFSVIRTYRSWHFTSRRCFLSIFHSIAPLTSKVVDPGS